MTIVRTLPRWESSMSDGCSALPVGPLWLRRRFNTWLFRRHPAASTACEGHDKAYYLGGSKQDRLEADNVMRELWILAGVPPWIGRLALALIKVGGSPGARIPEVSWSFGGDLFEYTDAPAREVGDRVHDSVK